ncbi:Proclotting enzyme [Nymphon striatum]|nr:Proclotting enzyme [Nymphon striatum]
MEHTAASLTFVIWTFLLFGALKCYQKVGTSIWKCSHIVSLSPLITINFFAKSDESHKKYHHIIFEDAIHDYHETKVDVGDFNIETDYEVQNQIFTVESIYIHWGFNSQKETFVNDIALLKLDKDVDFSRNVWPVCLIPQGLEIPDETVATVLGWGNIEKSGHGSKKLRKVNLKIYDDESCGRSSQILQLCAGDKSGQRDACQGDSGGPLVVTVQHAEMLVGIVSYGSGCAKSGASGGYTKISQYTDWIEKFSQSDIQCSAHVLHETDLPWQ